MEEKNKSFLCYESDCVVSFSSVIKALVPEERDKYLATASLAEISKFLPNLDYQNNKDLLPVAFNVCTVNRANKNGDGIGTDAALSFYKTFINKPINLEHQKNVVVGTILNVGFTAFGTDLPLTEAEVIGTTRPFNIVCGGVIWRHISKEFAKYVEDASCQDSVNYLGVSASWEVSFKNYNLILLGNGKRNYEDGLIIDNDEELKKYSPFLRMNKGSGRIDDSTEVFRNILSPVLALGTGFTATPAGSVVGVATHESIKIEEESESLAASKDILITVIDKNAVINTETIKNSITMFAKIEDITEESLKQSNASVLVQDFIKAEASKFEEAIKKASENFVAEKGAADKLVAEAKAQSEEAIAKLNEATKTLAEIRAELDVFKAEKVALAKQEAFNGRMASFDAEYDLTDEDRTVLGESIKDMPEEAYAKFQKNMFVLMKNKKKGDKAKPEDKKDEKAKAECDKEMEKEKMAKASEDADAIKVVATAIDNGDKVGGMPAGDVKSETLMSRFEKAFAPTKENYEIKSW